MRAPQCREAVPDRAEGRNERADVRLPAGGPVEGEPERARQAAQAGVGREEAEQRLRVDELLAQVPELVLGTEQEAVLAEVGQGVGALDRLEEVVAALEPVRQRRRGPVGGGRGLAGDEHEREVGKLRESPVDAPLLLPPGKVGGDQVVGVGIDAEAGGGEDRHDDAEARQQQRHDGRVPARECDHTGERA